MNLSISPLHTDDIYDILNWNADTGPEFLTQWAGNGYIYPLTYEQLAKRLPPNTDSEKCRIFKILLNNDRGEKIIGTAELNTHAMPKRTAMICRYLIAPAYQNQGYGCLSLILLSNLAFRDLGFKSLRLKVFAYNTRATRCYEKAGFSIIDTRQWNDSLIIHEMELNSKK
ncbi:MAG: GNAT family N-acetyltransferase [Clostridiales bacterium]|nr:GNAT family N-acetyltransferase [Clostridiales bacterium]